MQLPLQRTVSAGTDVGYGSLKQPTIKYLILVLSRGMNGVTLSYCHFRGQAHPRTAESCFEQKNESLDGLACPGVNPPKMPRTPYQASEGKQQPIMPYHPTLTSPSMHHSSHQCHSQDHFQRRPGGGPRVVVSTAAFHARVQGTVPGLGGLKETKMFLPHPRVKVSIVGSLRDREVACSASDRQGSNFKSCVWRTVSSQSSQHPQEVLLAQFSLYVHKGGLKPDSFHFFPAPTTSIFQSKCRHAPLSL